MILTISQVSVFHDFEYSICLVQRFYLLKVKQIMTSTCIICHFKSLSSAAYEICVTRIIIDLNNIIFRISCSEEL